MDRALEQGDALSTSAEHTVELRGLRKRFGATLALDGVSLGIRPGEFFTLLGPSGCGKTTTLRAVAGFVAPDAGDVLIDGVRVNGVPPHRRRVGMVFQHYALFPHRTVGQNVAFGLRMQGVEASEIGRRVSQALARALVTEPAVLLLDEPLGALDKKLRDHMKIELKRLQREVSITTIYVTHDQEEALTMSDRIAVMNRGRVEQVASPRALYETPATPFVASFIGNINLLAGVASGRGTVDCSGVKMAAIGLAAEGAEVTVALRPERVRLGPTEGADTTHAMTVAHVIYQGETVRYVLKTDVGLELQAVELGEVRFAVGARVHQPKTPESLTRRGTPSPFRRTARTWRSALVLPPPDSRIAPAKPALGVTI